MAIKNRWNGHNDAVYCWCCPNTLSVTVPKDYTRCLLTFSIQAPSKEQHVLLLLKRQSVNTSETWSAHIHMCLQVLWSKWLGVGHVLQVYYKPCYYIFERMSSNFMVVQCPKCIFPHYLRKKKSYDMALWINWQRFLSNKSQKFIQGGGGILAIVCNFCHY